MRNLILPLELIQNLMEVFKILKEVIECPKSDAKKFEIVHFTEEEKKVLDIKQIEDLIENS